MGIIHMRILNGKKEEEKNYWKSIFFVFAKQTILLQ